MVIIPTVFHDHTLVPQFESSMLYCIRKDNSYNNINFVTINKVTSLINFYAPNFGEVEGPYWFGPVRPSVCPSVRLSGRNTWQLRNSRTAYARILKLYMWHVHEK